MVQNMRDHGYMIGGQVLEGWNRAMVAYTRVLGGEIVLMVKESIFMQVELFTKAIGKTACRMALG